MYAIAANPAFVGNPVFAFEKPGFLSGPPPPNRDYIIFFNSSFLVSTIIIIIIVSSIALNTSLPIRTNIPNRNSF